MNCPFAEECSTAICPASRFLCFLCSFSIFLPARPPSLAGLDDAPRFPIKPCGIIQYLVEPLSPPAPFASITGWIQTDALSVSRLASPSWKRRFAYTRLRHVSRYLTRHWYLLKYQISLFIYYRFKITFKFKIISNINLNHLIYDIFNNIIIIYTTNKFLYFLLKNFDIYFLFKFMIFINNNLNSLMQ